MELGLVLYSNVRNTVLRTFESLDRASNSSDAINDREPFVAEIRFESSNAQSNGSEVHSNATAQHHPHSMKHASVYINKHHNLFYMK